MIWHKSLVSFFCILSIQFSQHYFFEESVLSLLYILRSFVKNELAVHAWLLFWTLISGPLIDRSDFVILASYFNYCLSAVHLDIRQCEASALFSFLIIVLTLQDFLFPYKVCECWTQTLLMWIAGTTNIILITVPDARPHLLVLTPTTSQRGGFTPIFIAASSAMAMFQSQPKCSCTDLSRWGKWRKCILYNRILFSL